MAHVVVEWTDNLEGQADIHGLLALIAATMREGEMFPWGGIRVRALKLTDYVVADGRADDAFVHITVTMGTGRAVEAKQRFFGDLFDRVKRHFAHLYETRYLALSLYVEEADEQVSFKHNNIHARFRSTP
ncbi:MAG: 5-carboxymethyl-2-hydroxymuconate Delta-isomerase [Parvibaculum sp.]|nr:5-carboxymethyl-2-hydroxymuconate Delta-isomerase [Parvibaculum sp.]